MSRTKPLTEQGNLFNLTGANFTASVQAYAKSLETTFLQKELQEFVSRFEWKGLPKEIDQQLMETMVYSKGQVSFFRLAGKYYVLPFAYTGAVNHYGIQTEHLPLPYNGVMDIDDGKQTAFATARKTVIFGTEDVSPDEAGVILTSTSALLPAMVYPPVLMTSGLRSKLVENLVLVRNNLILSQPIKYVSVETEAKASSVKNQVGNLFSDILNGNIVQTIVGNLTLKDINTEVPKLDQQSMWQSFSSLDNLRMEYLGILNNGVFQKKERELTDEVAGTQSSSKLALQDSLRNRQRFCKLVNEIWGLNISVELSEANKFSEEKEEADGREGSKKGLNDEPNV